MEYIIFDWKRTLYNPDKRTYIEGTLEVLNFLQKKGAKIVLIGKGSKEMYDEVERLGLKKYFVKIFFNEGEKQTALFTKFVDKKMPKQTIVVGDRIRSELKIGNSLKATTIWVRQGEFAKELPESANERPAFTVTSLLELKELLEKNNKLNF